MTVVYISWYFFPLAYKHESILEVKLPGGEDAAGVWMVASVPIIRFYRGSDREHESSTAAEKQRSSVSSLFPFSPGYTSKTGNIPRHVAVKKTTQPQFLPEGGARCELFSTVESEVGLVRISGGCLIPFLKFNSPQKSK